MKKYLRKVLSVALVWAMIVSIMPMINTSVRGDTAIFDVSISYEGKTNTIIKLARPKVSIVKRVEKNVKLRWKKVRKAKWYRIYRKSPGKKKYVLIKKTKRTQFIDKKAKKRQVYSYKVCAQTRQKGRLVLSKKSKERKAYVYPKELKNVIIGECFVEGLELWGKSYLPKNTAFVNKIGLSTYGMLTSKSFSANGKSVTAIEKAASYRPDRVYFLVGMNESKTYDTSATIGRLSKMISMLKAGNKHVEVVLMAIPPVGAASSANVPNTAQKAAFNKAYKKLADSKKNVYFMDYTKSIADSKGYLRTDCNGGDGCHWTVHGTQIVAKKITEFGKKISK